MSGQVTRANDLDVDLGTLFASIVRDCKRIVVFAGVITALAFLAAFFATPHFRAETRILIETRESVFTRPNAVGDRSNDPTLDETGVASQVQVMSSTDILKQVATQFELGKRPEFDEQANMGIVGRLMVLMGLKSDPGELAAEDRVINAMREKLNVYRVENSRVIVVEFSSEDRELAAAVPNAIADAYLAQQQRAKLQSNNDATNWLAPEIEDLRKRVKDAEGKVAAFRSSSDLMVGQNNSALATQQLSEMSTELTRVRAARATAESRAQTLRDAIRNGASLDSMPEVLSSPLIQRLRERQVELNTQIADLSTTLLDNHPRIKSLRSQLADMSAQVRDEAAKVLRGLETEAATARAREERLVSSLNVVKAESARVGDKEVELRALEREAASQRELLESYLTRYREASSRGDREYLPADARIFSRASVPADPYFPKLVPIVAAAFVGSMLIMVLFTLLSELFSGRAMRPASGASFEPVEQVVMPDPARFATREEAIYEEPEEQVVPAPEPRRVAPNDNRLSVYSAAERMIVDGVTRAIFVSPEGDQGAASSVLVAREMSDAGLRVLLLDLTSTGAASLPMTEDDELPGITNLLCAEAQFADVIQADLYSECHVIPVGTANAARAMRAADRLPIIMDSLTTAYDVVVVECGPADAEGIRRLVAGGTQVLVSATVVGDRSVAAAAANLTQGGYEDVVLVKPGDMAPPSAPQPTRSAA
ncbi:MAG: Wzz/FepE/Etk N-terminal domain-containing protein [Mesorhizobium sp.]